jgi:hypothetical protein
MKVGRTLKTVLGGVSQQPQHARLEGQHNAQVNMLIDPASGLSRRWGSKLVTSAAAPVDSGDPAQAAALSTMRRLEYTADRKDYVVLAAQTAGLSVPFVVYNLTDNLFVPVVFSEADLGVQSFMSGPCTAITSVGRYVFAASAAYPCQATPVQKWGDSGVGDYGRAAVWVRAGAYSRKLTVTVTKADNSVVTVTYDTPAAAYSGTLDTSGVPVFVADPAGGTIVDSEAAYAVESSPGFGKHRLNWGDWSPTALTVKRGASTLTNSYPAAPSGPNQYSYGAADPKNVLFNFVTGPDDVPVSISYTHAKVLANPNYTKIVGDMTNEYNSAVTAWITTAANALKPDAIAEELRSRLAAAGVTCVAVGSHVGIEGVKSVTADDGGDGTLLRAVAHTVSSTEDLTRKHYVGKTVKVQPSQSADAFYMKAEAKEVGATGWQDVVWVEGQATEYTLSGGLIYGIARAGTFYVASSAADLEALIEGPHPDFAKSTVGDDITSPLPFFVGRTITCLAMAQDRLIVAAGGVVRASKTSDYLNFFRGSVLTVAADDPFEVVSKEGNDDTIRYAVEYDQSLMLFGKRQYLLSGRQPLTPTNAILPAVSSHRGADDIAPAVAGSAVFYALRTSEGTSIHQMRPGQYAESVDSSPESAQLSDYIPGNAVELVTVPKPSLLLVRDTAGGLTTFTYLEQGGERRLASWGKLEYSTALGVMLGAVSTADGIVLLWARGSELVADLQDLSVGTCPEPYIDSRTAYTAPRGDVCALGGDHYGWFVAEDEAASLVATAPTAPAFTGWQFPAYVEPSRMFVLDNNGRNMLAGDLVVSSVDAYLEASGGVRATVTDEYGTADTYDSAYELADLATFGPRPVGEYTVTVPIGYANNAYTLRLSALDVMPLTLTGIGWSGQFYNRNRSM